MSFIINETYHKYKSMLGALTGDAAGATLEFCGKPHISYECAHEATTMPGGGYMGVAPGQITDDGELTLSLWRALKSSKAHETLQYPHKECIKEYISWYKSNPFDIGNTCSTAFRIFQDTYNDNITDDELFKSMYTIYTYNKFSEANGGLMRISALATWAFQNNIEWKIAVNMAKDDAIISHPNEVCQEVNAIYVFIILHLLNGYSPTDTLELVSQYVKEEIKSENVYNWFFNESMDIDKMNCKKNMGHVRHAFTLAIYFLRNPDITYEEAIKLTLMKGGDTDTNAAIVGGLVACYHIIPAYMLSPVLEFDSTQCINYNGYYRPEEYCIKYVISL